MESRSSAVRIALKRVDQYNPVGKAKNNVAHHYDLSGAMYDLFLDRDRQYSCAYFETDDGSLEDAQLAKKRHLAAKLDIKPGMKVLDIGSGWGGLGLYIAEICGAEVTGVCSARNAALVRELGAERHIEIHGLPMQSRGKPHDDATVLRDFAERIDVRSPSEYAEDHVPGAASHPVLGDAELQQGTHRAHIMINPPKPTAADVRPSLGPSVTVRVATEESAMGMVPPGFTITTEVCTVFYKNKRQYPADLDAQVSDALRALEGRTDKKFGDVRNPLRTRGQDPTLPEMRRVRLLEGPSLAVVYLAINVAALLRVASPFTGEGQAIVLSISGLAWSLAFAGFAIAYGGMLVLPRR